LVRVDLGRQDVRAEPNFASEHKDRIDDASVRVESIAVKGKPTQRRVFWTPPEDPNGIVVSYDIEIMRVGALKVGCVDGNFINET